MISSIHIIKQLVNEVRKRVSQRLRPIVIGIKTRLGIPVRFHSPARSVLENIILPYYGAQPRLYKVLFVGCDWYTNHYKKFFKNAEYWTIDPDPRKKRYGAKNHIVGYLENLGDYFEQNYFDLIICNGVLGFGLNQLEMTEQAFSSCFACLRTGGEFMLGRDDNDTLVVFPINKIESLDKFVPCEFPPLNTWRYSTKPVYEYVFCFYTKPYDNTFDVPKQPSTSRIV